MAKNIFTELSDAMAEAAEHAGKSTVLVDARKRFPASGVAISADTILTADHVVERDEDVKVILHDGTDKASATAAEVSKTPARVGQFVLAIGRPSSKGI